MSLKASLKLGFTKGIHYELLRIFSLGFVFSKMDKKSMAAFILLTAIEMVV